MNTITIKLSEEQLSRVIDAYKTIQEFLASILSPNELYQAQFLEGLKESDKDIRKGNIKDVKSFDDFTS